jgi:hypothetical protein
VLGEVAPCQPSTKKWLSGVLRILYRRCQLRNFVGEICDPPHSGDMTPHPAPAWPTTLATQVYRRLRSDLIEGIMPPGSKLKVEVLAAEKF